MLPYSSSPAMPSGFGSGVASWSARIVLQPLHLLAAAPTFLFLLALTAMLLRHPDVQFYEVDRIAFGLLVLGVTAHCIAARQKLIFFERATWPMLGLTAMALFSVAGQPFDPEAWSLLASKFIVPFMLFHLAALVFTDERRLRQFEWFAIVVLAYLSFTAISFLLGAHSLIFPRFILDESLGFHAERARGPLLQAVANGVSLNILGLLVLHAYQRGSVRGPKILLLLISLPIAILATMTRAVWLSFAGTIVALIVLFRKSGHRLACVSALIVFSAAFAFVLTSTAAGGSFSDRLEERGPLDYRQAVYSGGWEMFLERPLIGWGFHHMPGELPRYVSGYAEKVLYPHNTYLELLVEHGVVGLALYLWLMWELWQLGRAPVPAGEERGFLNQNFHRLWPVTLAVYWLNAAVVVMSYQFVNGLLFAMAGMLVAQRRRAEALQPC